jgi:hypothetical protein
MNKYNQKLLLDELEATGFAVKSLHQSYLDSKSGIWPSSGAAASLREHLGIEMLALVSKLHEKAKVLCQ